MLVASPTNTSSHASATGSNLRVLRASARTLYPASCRARTVCRPMYPVAPATNTVGDSLRRLDADTAGSCARGCVLVMFGFFVRDAGIRHRSKKARTEAMTTEPDF